MPITKDGKIEYTMPKEFKGMITYDFCKQFLKELHLIFGISLQNFDYDSVSLMEGTSGWNVSFSNVCKQQKKDELYKYYCFLPWYESDIFDSELTQILVENKLLLPFSEIDEISRQLKIDINDITCCGTCGRYFTAASGDVIEIDEFEHVCKECLKKEKVKPLNYDIFKAIKFYLNYDKNDYFICKKCGKIHSNNHKGEQYCLYCEQELVPNTNVNKYYRESLEENYKYHDSLIPYHIEYKGYMADVFYSYDDELWYGKVLPIENKEKFKDLISFHSFSRDDIKNQFEEAVDDYLDFKEEIKNS